MKFLLWALIAVIVFVITIQRCNAQVIATFHPQFSEKRTTSWEMCASNRTTANTSVGMADIYRVTAGRMNVLNSSSRAYEMRMRPRNRWLRGIQIAAAAASFLQATPVIDIGDSWQYLFPGLAGGLQIAGPAIEGNRRENFELGNYWDDTRTLAAGESACSMVMSIKVKDPRSFAAVLSAEVPMDPQGARFEGPALPLPASPSAVLWEVPRETPLSLLAVAACVVRPSSVETEGCGAWYE
jgi:hypothetical protein